MNVLCREGGYWSKSTSQDVQCVPQNGLGRPSAMSIRRIGIQAVLHDFKVKRGKVRRCVVDKPAKDWNEKAIAVHEKMLTVSMQGMPVTFGKLVFLVFHCQASCEFMKLVKHVLIYSCQLVVWHSLLTFKIG